MKATYRSSRGEEVYETEVTGDREWSCTCPSFRNRGTCGHAEQLQRWIDWGQPEPTEILDPPPPMGSWEKEVTDES